MERACEGLDLPFPTPLVQSIAHIFQIVAMDFDLQLFE
jgi:hypothetical protein